MKIITNNFILKTLDLDYSIDIMEYNKRNQDFHKFSMPKKNEDFFTLESTKKYLEVENALMKNKEFYRFYVFQKNDDKIIGDLSLIDIKYNFISSCYVGIKIDKDNINIGIGNEVLGGLIDFVKNELKLHTMRATILPNNIASKSLFEKNGFEFNGMIKHLFYSINGWEDHFLYSKIVNKV